MSENVLFPLYFLWRWREKEGYSPVSAKSQYWRYRKISVFGTAILCLLVTFYFAAFFFFKANLGLLVTSLSGGAGVFLVAIMMGADEMASRCKERVSRFEHSFAKLARRLGKTPEQLAALDVDAARAAAEGILQDFDLCLMAVGGILEKNAHPTGNMKERGVALDVPPHPARKALWSQLESCYAEFERWDMVSPAGLESYLRSWPERTLSR